MVYFARVKDYSFGTLKTLLFKSFDNEKEARKWLLLEEQATDNVRLYELLVLKSDFENWKIVDSYVC